MVTAAEFSRSFRGAAALLNRRPDALREFEISPDAFWRSFAAILLTLPAYVVELALLRHRLGLAAVGPSLFDQPGLAILAAAGHILAFLALPLAMIVVARRLGLGRGYVPFVIVTNWLAVFTSFALAIPGTLLLLGLETRELAALFTGAFALVALYVQWHATRVTLGVGAPLAAAVTTLGIALSIGTDAIVQALA